MEELSAMTARFSAKVEGAQVLVTYPKHKESEQPQQRLHLRIRVENHGKRL
jgi:hypothetical protein